MVQMKPVTVANSRGSHDYGGTSSGSRDYQYRGNQGTSSSSRDYGYKNKYQTDRTDRLPSNKDKDPKKPPGLTKGVSWGSEIEKTREDHSGQSKKIVETDFGNLRTQIRPYMFGFVTEVVGGEGSVDNVPQELLDHEFVGQPLIARQVPKKDEEIVGITLTREELAKSIIYRLAFVQGQQEMTDLRQDLGMNKHQMKTRKPSSKRRKELAAHYTAMLASELTNEPWRWEEKVLAALPLPQGVYETRQEQGARSGDAWLCAVPDFVKMGYWIPEEKLKCADDASVEWVRRRLEDHSLRPVRSWSNNRDGEFWCVPLGPRAIGDKNAVDCEDHSIEFERENAFDILKMGTNPERVWTFTESLYDTLKDKIVGFTPSIRAMFTAMTENKFEMELLGVADILQSKDADIRDAVEKVTRAFEFRWGVLPVRVPNAEVKNDQGQTYQEACRANDSRIEEISDDEDAVDYNDVVAREDHSAETTTQLKEIEAAKVLAEERLAVLAEKMKENEMESLRLLDFQARLDQQAAMVAQEKAENTKLRILSKAEDAERASAVALEVKWMYTMFGRDCVIDVSDDLKQVKINGLVIQTPSSAQMRKDIQEKAKENERITPSSMSLLSGHSGMSSGKPVSKKDQNMRVTLSGSTSSKDHQVGNLPELQPATDIEDTPIVHAITEKELASAEQPGDVGYTQMLHLMRVAEGTAWEQDNDIVALAGRIKAIRQDRARQRGEVEKERVRIVREEEQAKDDVMTKVKMHQGCTLKMQLQTQGSPLWMSDFPRNKTEERYLAAGYTVSVEYERMYYCVFCKDYFPEGGFKPGNANSLKRQRQLYNSKYSYHFQHDGNYNVDRFLGSSASANRYKHIACGEPWITESIELQMKGVTSSCMILYTDRGEHPDFTHAHKRECTRGALVVKEGMEFHVDRQTWHRGIGKVRIRHSAHRDPYERALMQIKVRGLDGIDCLMTVDAEWLVKHSTVTRADKCRNQGNPWDLEMIKEALGKIKLRN